MNLIQQQQQLDDKWFKKGKMICLLQFNIIIRIEKYHFIMIESMMITMIKNQKTKM